MKGEETLVLMLLVFLVCVGFWAFGWSWSVFFLTLYSVTMATLTHKSTTYTDKRKTLRAGEVWSIKLWSKNVENWSKREQDHTYRIMVSWLGWSKLFDKFARQNWSRTVEVFDSGCGDGTETLFFWHDLMDRGLDVVLTAFEPQERSATIARKLYEREEYPAHTPFVVVTEFPEQLKQHVDLLLSSYVLHDVADVEAYVAENAALLRSDGWAGFMIVHPDFVEAMIRKGAVREEPTLDLPGKNWERALEYPIVEQAGTFYVPLFHRSTHFYLALLKRHFSQFESYPLQVGENAVALMAKHGMLPFCNTPENVYYPEIVQVPSSLLFVCRT